jgi:aminopeptidase
VELLLVSDPRIEKWAETLVNFCVEVRPGQSVAIIGGTPAEPLLRAVYREVIRAGGYPTLVPTLNGLNADLLSLGNDEQIAWISPWERFFRTEADALIQVLAETNTKAMSNVDPQRQRAFQRARTEIRQIFDDRDAAGRVKWTLTLYPTDAYAQDADMSTTEYADFVLAACKLNAPDPVASWRTLSAEQQRLIEWLSDKDEIHVVGTGTDLRLSTKGRIWINADGTKNFPDGEIFTGPIEDSVNGTVRFSYPAVYAGREVTDVRLTFRDGRVVEADAAKGEDFLLKTLDTDDGARYLGEFAFGTNFDIQRFTKNILFDEKIGGTIHMALGSAYLETGSQNRSAIHWDMLCELRDGGQVDVDGQAFMRDGRFVV